MRFFVRFKLGMSYYAFNARCIDGGSVGLRHICKTKDGYYALFYRDGDPGYAVWYNDSKKAEEELGASQNLDGPGGVFGAKLHLCINEKRAIAALVTSQIEGLVYVFHYFDWRLGKIVGPAFPVGRNLRGLSWATSATARVRWRRWRWSVRASRRGGPAIYVPQL